MEYRVSPDSLVSLLLQRLDLLGVNNLKIVGKKETWSSVMMKQSSRIKTCLFFTGKKIDSSHSVECSAVSHFWKWRAIVGEKKLQMRWFIKA